MNSALFLVARIALADTAKDADWLTDDDSAFYQEIDVLDLPAGILSRVFDLYQATYSHYGNLLIPHQDGLLKYNRWILVLRDDAAADSVLGELDPADIIAFALMRTVVPVEEAIRVLEALGKSADPTQNEHYERELGNIGRQEKVMVGVPWLAS